MHPTSSRAKQTPNMHPTSSKLHTQLNCVLLCSVCTMTNHFRTRSITKIDGKQSKLSWSERQFRLQVALGKKHSGTFENQTATPKSKPNSMKTKNNSMLSKQHNVKNKINDTPKKSAKRSRINDGKPQTIKFITEQRPNESWKSYVRRVKQEGAEKMQRVDARGKDAHERSTQVHKMERKPAQKRKQKDEEGSDDEHIVHRLSSINEERLNKLHLKAEHDDIAFGEVVLRPPLGLTAPMKKMAKLFSAENLHDENNGMAPSHNREQLQMKAMANARDKAIAAYRLNKQLRKAVHRKPLPSRSPSTSRYWL